MEKHKIAVSELEGMYYLSDFLDLPGASQKKIYEALKLTEEEYTKIMEEKYHGVWYTFDIMDDDYDENDQHFYQVIQSSAISFENISDANNAKDWVESQLLGKQLSEPQFLIGIDYGYKVDSVFVDYAIGGFINVNDRSHLEQIKKQLLSYSRLRNK